MRWILALVLASAAWAGETPRRVISTAPSITEMLFAVGAGERVVGVTDFCRWPAAVAEIPKIGTYVTPNVELILSLKPDLAVVLPEHGDLAARLERLGIPVLLLSHNDLAGIHRSMRAMGERLGLDAEAEAAIGRIEARLAAVRAKTAEADARRVMFVVGRTPGTLEGIVAVGKGSFLNELIAVAGGRNVFADAPQHYPTVNHETIYAQAPEVIIDFGDMANEDRESRERSRRDWDELATLPAVETERIHMVWEGVFVVPGPRVAEAAERMLGMIHPELAP